MSERARRICVVTGSRAEYGLLFWLLHEIQDDPDLELQLVVTGMHLAAQHGETWRVIEADGFGISAKVDMLLADDSDVAMTKSVGLGTIGMADAFASLDPDVIVVLGDRFEILSAAQSAMLGRYPLAHIHGGELTEGAIDDSIRHAITKMAHLHFVTAEPYRQRLLQMGEAPNRVHMVGAPGLDNISRLSLLDRDNTEDALNIAAGETFFLVTYHPATLGSMTPAAAVAELIAALESDRNRRIVVTGVNADPGHSAVGQAFHAFAAANPGRVSVHASLGQLLYLSAMRHCSAVIGNSSSGVIEAPAMGVPTVNIGDRQKGRLRTPSIIDCQEHRDAIIESIARACDPAFYESAFAAHNAAPLGTTSIQIKDALKLADLQQIRVKRFVDTNNGETA